MLTVRGFRGIRYTGEGIASFDDVITPPFDVIGETERASLAAKSPHNAVHLILPEASEGRDPYENAAFHLRANLRSGVMCKDGEESYYLLEQEFSGSGGSGTRRGFFGVAKIPEEGEGVVLGHERTFPHKIQDRLELTRATHANLGAIFVLYKDSERALRRFLGQMDGRPADLEARTIDGVTQRLWRVPAEPAVAEFFRDKTLYIADGHHRYATAEAFRMETASRASGGLALANSGYVLMGFVSLKDPGLMVRAAHRVLSAPRGLSEEELLAALDAYFEVRPVRGEILPQVEGAGGCAFGLVLKDGGRHLLRLKDSVDRRSFLGEDHGACWRDLDVAVLHRGILENLLELSPEEELVYEPNAEKALARCGEMDRGMAFLLKPATPAQICACADAGEFMPQKATYLFPKLPTGCVIHDLA